jgi:hypothetical protein
VFEEEISEGFAGCEDKSAAANRRSRRARGDREACSGEDEGEFCDVFDGSQCE